MPRGYVCEQRYGVVIFDDPVNVKKGWACISGDTPFYVISIGDLDTNVTWHTNVGLKTFYQKGLSQSSKLRSDGYLRTKLSSIVIELGLRAYPNDLRAKILSDLFATVMQFYSLHTGLIKAPIGTLNNGVRRVCLPEEQSISNDVREAAQAAVHPHVLCKKNSAIDSSSLVSLVFHRFKYAKDILSMELPVGRWERASSLILNENQKYLYDWIRKSEKPALIKVNIFSVLASVNHLMDYESRTGLHADKFKTFNEMVWMTSLEYLELSKYADMQVEDIYTAQGFGYNPVTIPNWGRFSENSYAFGLYCESLWTSLTRTLDGRSAETPLSAWIHSVDRLKCLSRAISINNCENVAIHSYGYGRITLQVNNSRRSQMPDIAVRHKLVAPMAATPEERRQRIVPADPSHVELMQVAMDRGAIDFIERINVAALDNAIELYEQTLIKNTPKSLLTQ